MKKAGYRQVKADSPNVIRMGGGRDNREVAELFATNILTALQQSNA